MEQVWRVDQEWCASGFQQQEAQKRAGIVGRPLRPDGGKTSRYSVAPRPTDNLSKPIPVDSMHSVNALLSYTAMFEQVSVSNLWAMQGHWP